MIAPYPLIETEPARAATRRQRGAPTLPRARIRCQPRCPRCGERNDYYAGLCNVCMYLHAGTMPPDVLPETEPYFAESVVAFVNPNRALSMVQVAYGAELPPTNGRAPLAQRLRARRAEQEGRS